MKITLAQWRLINKKIREARQVLQEADDIVVNLVLEYSSSGDTAEKELLLKLSTHLNDGGPAGWAYMTHPQTEWLGGDSSEPRNFTIREPNIVPFGKKFPDDQVAADPIGPAMP